MTNIRGGAVDLDRWLAPIPEVMGCKTRRPGRLYTCEACWDRANARVCSRWQPVLAWAATTSCSTSSPA
jgi:hypothetical protein